VSSDQSLPATIADTQSWGTKGSDKVNEDLGVVKSGDNKNEVMVMIPTEQKDLNAVYENEMRIINSKPPKEESNIAPDQKQEDYYKVSED
jgi:chitin synthase